MRVVSYITNLDTEESIEFNKLEPDKIIQYEIKIKSNICQNLRQSINKIVIQKDS